MSTKKLFFILISLVMVFGLAGPVAADAPQTVECQISWVTSDYQDMVLIAEGQLVTNGHGFELICHYDIDFNDPGIGSIAQACEYWGSWACNADGNNVVIQNIYFYFFHEGEWFELADADMIVNTNGHGTLHAQYAPNQCSELKSFNWTLEFPPGYWTTGMHTYTIIWEIPGVSYDVYNNEFYVDQEAPLYPYNVRMGLYGLSMNPFNPAQGTFMQITEWVASSLAFLLEYDQANSIVSFSWDGGDPVEIQPSPMTNFCGWDNAYLVRTYGYAK